MSHLIKIYAVCKFSYLHLVVKELRVNYVSNSCSANEHTKKCLVKLTNSSVKKISSLWVGESNMP